MTEDMAEHMAELERLRNLSLVSYPPRPVRGDTVLLVYVECECRNWGAQPEGGFYVRCRCGKAMEPMTGDPRRAKEQLGFAATLMLEQEAFQRVVKAGID
jgi:hypothetical protein